MLVQLHKCGISSSFGGATKHIFCFKMLLKVSDLVSGAHLFPLKSFLIKDRNAWGFVEAFSLSHFPFLLPHTPFHNKQLLFMHTPFLSDGIPVSNSTVFQNSCPTPSDLYSAPRSKLPLFRVPSLKWWGGKDRNQVLHPYDPGTSHQEMEGQGVQLGQPVFPATLLLPSLHFIWYYWE